MIKKSVKGVVACILHWYTAELLCRDQVDAVEAFANPAATNLPVPKQLAIGMLRDLIIIPRLGSRHAFWLAHEQMRLEGGSLHNPPILKGFKGHREDLLNLLADAPSGQQESIVVYMLDFPTTYLQESICDLRLLVDCKSSLD